jgi:peptide/nickel transport system substrate-binding protein/oligopeptide transport system substrate-binding protein
MLFFDACASGPFYPDGAKVNIIEESTTGIARSRKAPSARDELVVVMDSGDIELDFRASYMARDAQIFAGIYEGLFSYNPITMEPVPAVASRWEVSADKKTWTFHLKRMAKYSNGDELKAGDFRAAWISLLNPKAESPYSSLFDIIEGAADYRTGKLKNDEKVGIIAENDRTLVVKLTSPASFFPYMLCHHSFSPIHPSQLLINDWSVRPPVGNGPFFIAEMSENEIILEKNTFYWDSDMVDLNKIMLKFIDNASEAAAMWNSGEARWISGNVEYEKLTDRSGVVLNPLFATHYYYVRQGKKPWNDYRVRQALALSLPWDEIRDDVFLPAKTLISPVEGYPEVDGLETTDIPRAKELLSLAGFPEGRGLPTLVIRVTPGESAVRIGTLLAGAWKTALGVNAKVDVVPFEKYFSSLKQSDYDIGSTTWIGDFADPYTFLQMWRTGSNLNDALHNDADFEALIDRSMSEDGEERLATLAEAEQLLLDRGSVYPISYSPALNIIDMEEIEGWYPNALDIHPFKYLSFAQLKPLPGVVMAK